MKGIFAIISSVAILASGMTFSIDRHYCGGELAARRISVSGKLASCGMEKVQNNCSNQPSLDKKCCDDQVTFYRISSKYLPEYFRLSYTSDFKDITSVPVCNVLIRGSNLAINWTWEFPPGVKLKSAPALSEICVFRI
jgi:hypothetical protein